MPNRFRSTSAHDAPLTATDGAWPALGRSRGGGVVAVAAHPDDLELACGGTLARLAASGRDVHALVMSRGGAGGDAVTRVQEARWGARAFGAATIAVHDLPDTRLHDHENEMAALIEDALRRLSPSMVLTHSTNDHHQDHRAVHVATLRAARRHPAVLCFESPSITDSFRPTVFVDIEGYVDAKIDAVAMHRDQRTKPYMEGACIRALAMFRGTQARVRHAEGFEAVRVHAPFFDLPVGDRGAGDEFDQSCVALAGAPSGSR